MNLFSELRRRNIFKVAAAYLALAWVTLQIADIVIPALGLPDMIITAMVVIGIIGLPFALFFAWAYELTPEGMKRTEEVELEKSIRATTGQKINYIIIGLLSVAVIFLLFNQNGEPDIDITDKTIAVMPFADMSADGSQEYFGDGIAEEILNVLVGIDELSVTSRTSSFAYKGSNQRIPDIAAELGVNYVLEGSVRTDGDMVRVTAQLIDVAADAHLWSDTFDRELTSIFAIQDEISRSITDALRVELVGGEPLKVAITDDMVAYDFYLRGRQIFLARGDITGLGDEMERAIGYYQRAVELDPTFAEAWADLAAVYHLIPEYGIKGYEGQEHKVLSNAAADRAIGLKPDLSQAWAIKGLIDLGEFKFQEAKTALEHAIKLNEQNEAAWLWLGQVYAAVGDHQSAENATTRAIEISPDTKVNYYFLARSVHTSGDMNRIAQMVDEYVASENYESVIDSPYLTLELIFVALDEGDLNRATELFVELNRFYSRIQGLPVPDDLEENVSLLISAHVDPELRQQAKDLIRGDDFRFLFAFILNDAEFVVDQISSSRINKGASLAFYYYPMARPLFQEKVTRDYFIEIGMFDYWNNNAFPDFCRPVGEDDFECQDAQGNWP